ncbi:uncharacterized protein LOC9634765 [Selaginella moellendorffii]|uniref:uncharacterized protein LOC9634765 n=1 Tax=Selaginella moellendorffii TaxID=88036 RepID=UPI000D1CF5A8|nr:uncharacterized protein LOC9634765 [Selaginella moellendorffii]XP_024540277.1 uncharacterized protein LOC9634765 [Selaginella moellendorffii]|eukprot:XP_024540276.1 uncharacterized protein LOC9634765 [Selaginella moellendorffii]
MTKERGHVVHSGGCRSLQFVPGLSSPSPAVYRVPRTPLANGPFRGLIICVTGLSKEVRAQVQDATERMGGVYSPDLHPQCTHLVVQSFVGRKFEHALKHGVKRGLFVVTLAWFINSAKLNERLDESLYAVSKNSFFNAVISPEQGLFDGEHACLPSRFEESKSGDISVKSLAESPNAESKRGLLLRGFTLYLDPCLSEDVQAKVVAGASKEGATFADNWYSGSDVTHVVCERDSFLTYTGSTCNLVTPLWLLKSLKEHALQRMVQLSTDLARHLAFVADLLQSKSSLQNEDAVKSLQTEREELVKNAKEGVRRRRGQRKQPCRTLPRPITGATLLDGLCWSVTDCPSAAKVYAEISPSDEFFDAPDNGNTSGSESDLFARPLTESERQEIIYNAVFLTVMFPVDRFAEMGPSSRSFFCENGFTRQQIMENIYQFYQEPLSEQELNVAINTDSKHADKLRALYAARGSSNDVMKRHEFIGGRRCFDGLKRLSRENTGQIYELLLAS